MLKVDIQQFYDMLDKGHLLTFERAHDTKRVLEVLPKRFAKYGLRLHPDKTRLFPFHRPGIGHRASGDGRRVAGDGWRLGTSSSVLRPVGVYPFLGTLPQRLLAGEAQDGTGSLLNRAVQKISDWCRRNRLVSSQAVGPSCLLRDHRQWRSAVELQVCRRAARDPESRLLRGGQRIEIDTRCYFVARPGVLGQQNGSRFLHRVFFKSIAPRRQIDLPRWQPGAVPAPSPSATLGSRGAH